MQWGLTLGSTLGGGCSRLGSGGTPGSGGGFCHHLIVAPLSGVGPGCPAGLAGPLRRWICIYAWVRVWGHAVTL